MPFSDYLNTLGADDPLLKSMLSEAGAKELDEIKGMLESIDSQAEAANFLNQSTHLSEFEETRGEQGTDCPPIPVSQVGDYQLIRQIGRGGFGRVFLSTHKDSPTKLVAVKIFDGQWMDDLQRLEVERLVLQELDHPNLVKAVDFGKTESGIVFLVMELIDGIRIDQFVRQGNLGYKSIAQLFTTIADAMEYAHNRDVIHRDLKPGNILVTSDGKPVVTDFGLAKRLNLAEEKSLTKTGVLIGTLGYLAPEQADTERREVTRLVDVYGLGATLYQVLTGHPPFERDNLLKMLDEMRTRPPRAPRTLRADIPVDLEQICIKCLAKSPHDRYESMLALAKDLKRFVAGRPVAARPPTWLQQLQRWCVTNPVVSLLTISLFFSITVGLIASTAFWIKAATQQQHAASLLEKAREILQSGDRVAEGMLPQTPFSLAYRRQRLTQSVSFLDDLIAQYPNDDELFRESATAYFRLGKVCCLAGEWEQGLNAYTTAFERFTLLSITYPDDHTLRFDVFHCLLGLDHIDRDYLKLESGTLGKMGEALKIIEQLADSEPDNIDYADALLCNQYMACFKEFPGETPELIEALEAIYARATLLKSKLPEPCLQWRYVGAAAQGLATTHMRRGELERADFWMDIAFRETKAFVAQPDLDPGNLADWADCLTLGCQLEAKKGNRDRAAELAQEWREFLAQCIAKHPDYQVFPAKLAAAERELGEFAK